MKINCVLLAAGNSRRFKGNKLLYQVNGKPLYQAALDILLPIPWNRMILVTQYPEIVQNVPKTVHVVWNHQPDLGISHSIQLGIEADLQADAYLFSVCDQPYLTANSIEKLLELFVHSNKGIAALSYQGRSGNPVIFSKKYSRELLQLSGDQGGKMVLQQHTKDVSYWEVEHEIELMDIDR